MGTKTCVLLALGPGPGESHGSLSLQDPPKSDSKVGIVCGNCSLGLLEVILLSGSLGRDHLPRVARRTHCGLW